MTGRFRNVRAALPVWLWALLPMLLAAALVAPVLNRDIFDVDEAATMIGAGARHLGPVSPAEAIRTFMSRWPDHPWGQVAAFNLWGRFVGWSELAIRVLPFLCGILSIAWVYRLGRDLFRTRFTRVATLLLSTSVLVLTYMHVARSYTAALLLAAIVLWGYWHVTLNERSPGHGARLALCAGATGLLYSNYFCALLLPALGLFHLLFVRRNRRWWQTTVLLAMAFVLAMPQIPDLLQGIQHNAAKSNLHAVALRSPEVVSLFLRFLSNNLINPHPVFGTLLIIVLLVFIAVAAWRRRSSHRQPASLLFLAVTAAFQLLILLGINERLQVLEQRRIRYLATLWPSVVLLLDAGVNFPKGRLLRFPGRVMMAAIALFGATGFLLNGDLIQHSWKGRQFPVSIPIARLIAEQASELSLLLVDVDAFRYENRSYEFYTGIWEKRRVRLRPDTDSSELVELAWSHDRILLLFRKSAVERLNIDAHLDLFSQQGWSLHGSWQNDQVILLQYDSPLQTGLVDQPGLQFDRNVRLTGPVMVRQDDRLTLRVGLHSSDHVLLARYSLAVHVIDARSGERVAQGDVGVGPGTFVPVYSEMDISALPAATTKCRSRFTTGRPASV